MGVTLTTGKEVTCQEHGVTFVTEHKGRGFSAEVVVTKMPSQ